MAGGVVFSALRHGEGVTTVICNLAEHVASEFNKRVILIDANFRTPALQDLYGLYGCPGLTEVLSGTATVREAIYGQRDGRIFVMPAGMTNQVDGALLCEEIVPELIAQSARVLRCGPVRYRAAAILSGRDHAGTACQRHGSRC